MSVTWCFQLHDQVCRKCPTSFTTSIGDLGMMTCVGERVCESTTLVDLYKISVTQGMSRLKSYMLVVFDGNL